MDDPSAEQVLAALLADSAVPLLKEHGFRKRKLTFTRERDGLVDVVNLQRSAGNSHESIRFYVNCGVYSTEFDRTIGKSVQERPAEVDCQYRRRIEDITSGIGPHVTVEADTDVPAVAHRLRTALTEALAVMGALRNADDVARSVGSDIDFGVLRYRLAIGDVTGAREQYLRARATFGAEDRWPRLEDMFRRSAGTDSAAVVDAERS